MNTERLRCIVSGLSRYELTEMEQRFAQSVEQYFKQEGKLTAQQESILENLYRKKTKRSAVPSARQTSKVATIILKKDITPDTELVESVPDLWDISHRPIKADNVSKTRQKLAKRSGQKG